MTKIRLGNRVNRISSGRIGYVPTTDKEQRAITKKYNDKLKPLYAVRDLQIYCYWKHDKLTNIEIARKFGIKSNSVIRIVIKMIKLFKKWREEKES